MAPFHELELLALAVYRITMASRISSQGRPCHGRIENSCRAFRPFQCWASGMHVFSVLDTDPDNGNSKFWKEGFEAGKALDSRCPYRAGSPQARDWLEGWAVGIHEPSERVQVQAQLQEKNEEPPTGRWRVWLKGLLGR